MVFDEKPAKTLKLRRWKLRGLKQNQVSIPNYIYIKMTSIKRYTPLAFLRGKHSRIRATPTQFQNFGKILKIEFPGNWTKTWNVSKLFHSCYSL